MRQETEISDALTEDEVRSVQVLAKALIACRSTASDGRGTGLAAITVEAICDAVVAVGGQPRDVDHVRAFWLAKGRSTVIGRTPADDAARVA